MHLSTVFFGLCMRPCYARQESKEIHTLMRTSCTSIQYECVQFCYNNSILQLILIKIDSSRIYDISVKLINSCVYPSNTKSFSSAVSEAEAEATSTAPPKSKQTSPRIRQRRAKQKLRKELNQACRQEEEPMRRAEERIASVRSYLLKKDGFLANPKLSPRHNAENILAETKVSEITSRIPNMNYHNLCTHLTPPAGVGDLLGLSLPFCLQAPRPNQDIGKTMSQLRRDVRRKAFFAISEDEPNNNYNPKLHISSPWEPPRASNDIERRMDALEQKLEQIACENQRKKKQSSNITRKQWAMIKYLRQNDDFMIVPTDKNLGPAIIERSTYIERAWSEHLSDPNTYEVIPPCKLDALKSEMTYLISLIRFLGVKNPKS